MPDVIVAGHICLDIIPELNAGSAFEPGRLIEAGPALLCTGGAVSNTGLALMKLGCDTMLLGMVGRDLFGEAVLRHLGLAGDTMIVSESEPTSYTVVISPPGEDRTFIHSPGCNSKFRADNVSEEHLRSTQLLHFGYPPLMEQMFENDGDELVALFQKAKDCGATTVLDMSLPDLNSNSGRANWNRILERVLPFCDLFLPSIEEMLFMLDRPSYVQTYGGHLSSAPARLFDRLATVALEMGGKIVGIKAGSRGLYLRSFDRLSNMGRALEGSGQWSGVQLWAPCFEITPVGTTGAGDATIAGLIAGILRGMDPYDSARLAVAVGACCCEQADAVSGVPSFDALQDRIASGWKRVNLRLENDWVAHPSGSRVKINHEKK